MSAQLPTNHPYILDFRHFLAYIWHCLNLPKPTPIQYDIAKFLQHGPERSIIEAFRGVGKSWITSAYVCWLLLVDPNTKILVVSASKDRADAFSTFTKRLIREVDILQHLQPDTRKGHRDSNVAFDVGPATADHAPSVKSVGISGQLAGSRANVIIPDDVEVPNNSMTQLMRDRLGEAVKEFDAILKPGGRIIYLGTPQTEMSLYNVLAERGYIQRIWPTRYPKQKLMDAYGDRLAPYIREKLLKDPSLGNSQHHTRYGQPTDTARFDELDLLKREASYGRSGFALQFMLDTSVSDGDRYPLKLSDLIVMGTTIDLAPAKVAWGSGEDQVIKDIPAIGLSGDRLHRPAFKHNDWVEYTGSVLVIDPSGRGADETSYAVVKMLNGFLYIRHCSGFPGGYDEKTLQAIANLAKTEKVNAVLVESNFGDGMFNKLLEPYLKRTYPVTLEEVRQSSAKEARIIDTLEPVLNQHRLVIDESILKEDAKNPDRVKKTLSYQLTRLTKDRGSLAFDDRVDVLEMGVRYWLDQMSKDVSSIEDEHIERLREEALARFMENALGSDAVTPSNWTDNF